jgi:hypothetical protein
VPPRRGRVPAVASTPTVVVEHREPPGQQRRQGAVTIRPAEPPHSRITGSPSLKRSNARVVPSLEVTRSYITALRPAGR